MSRRYRITALALGLIFLAGLGKAQEQAQDEQGQVQTEQKPAQTLPIPLPVDIIEDEATANSRKSREAESRQHEIDDLAAQQGMNAATQAMNEATQRMADYSLYSTVLVGVGTILLFVTLWLTRQANRAAIAAATHAETANEIIRAGQRPWLSIETPKISNVIEANKEANSQSDLPYRQYAFRLSVRVANSGTMPARNVNIFVKTADQYEPAEGPIPGHRFFEENGSYVCDVGAKKLIDWFDEIAGDVSGYETYAVAPGSSITHVLRMPGDFKVSKKNMDLERFQSVLVVYAAYFGTEEPPKLHKSFCVYEFYQDGPGGSFIPVNELFFEEDNIRLRQIDGQME
ncbi:hypothetical protein AUC69_05030 [Methyloceanibacter superfactus]|uniref:DUF4352 domain-containing protein n=1 Tax=Methyloceanibacter superfactus TaxID=1774969 RepID=A0A1E3W750_9HYPH|nr:hypothetical protein [Methyloceanibacter superfactus]ODS01639.1 hypothetical protein AUC69_05030 [Methyloceanibacter superfactus]